MTFFPLVLIPTFAVPLGFILHIYSIRRTWNSYRRTEATKTRGLAPQEVAVAG
jgi:hypothetical protein